MEGVVLRVTVCSVVRVVCCVVLFVSCVTCFPSYREHYVRGVVLRVVVFGDSCRVVCAVVLVVYLCVTCFSSYREC